MPRKNEICIRADDQDMEQFRKFKTDHKIKFHGEAFRSLLALEGSEVFFEYQNCEFFGEYAPDSKHFIQCSRSNKKVIKKREHCQACSLSRINKVPLERKEKLEKETMKMQVELQKIKGAAVEGKRELEKIEELAQLPEKIKQLEQLISEKDRKIEELDRKLNKKDEEIAKKDENMASLQTDYDVLLNEKIQHSKIEPLHSDQKDAPEIVEKTAPSPSEKITREVTEKTEKYTKEIIEKPIAQIDTNNDLEKAKVFHCPDKNRKVNIDEECGHCSKIVNCSDYSNANEKIRELSA
jgi:hypothetical protein